ncbi:helix-turn-helix transcriptional regulator [Actinoplanes sp. NPDC049316]|uniref:helix-turn-helix domain-containing protein n=1 Tax=Actinoplanes sp. NPDC049316 TaxID=3154727 RepID=UPI00344813AD
MPDVAERERLRASVGAVLRRARATARLSQPALAVLAGCDRRTVQRLEAGQLRPTTALLAALAHALSVPPGWSPAGRRRETAALRLELEAAAGGSLVQASARRERWRRRRHRRAYRAASKAALPFLRAQLARREAAMAARLAEADRLIAAAARLR